MQTQSRITLGIVAFLVLLSYFHVDGQFQCACQYQIQQVCGRNGRTYDNSCLANCAGTVSTDRLVALLFETTSFPECQKEFSRSFSRLTFRFFTSFNSAIIFAVLLIQTGLRKRIKIQCWFEMEKSIWNFRHTGKPCFLWIFRFVYRQKDLTKYHLPELLLKILIYIINNSWLEPYMNCKYFAKDLKTIGLLIISPQFTSILGWRHFFPWFQSKLCSIQSKQGEKMFVSLCISAIFFTFIYRMPHKRNNFILNNNSKLGVSGRITTNFIWL